MTTKNITVTPSAGWVLIHTGPTETPISVEKYNGTGISHLAVSSGFPSIKFGHVIRNGELRNASLNDGESLYLKCDNELSPEAVNYFTITGA